MKKFTKSEYLLLLAVIQSAVTIIMNVFCMKPLSFGLKIIVMDGGLLISWMVFAVSNIVTEAYGEKLAKKITVYSAVTSFFLLVIGVIITLIPTTSEYYDQNIHFKYVFSNGIRTYIASIIAYVVGTFVNIMILSRLKFREPLISEHFKNLFLKMRTIRGSIKGKPRITELFEVPFSKKEKISSFFIRSVIASIFGQFVDNMIFELFAFMPLGISIFEMRYSDLFTAIIFSTIFETVVLFIFTLTIINRIVIMIKKSKN